MAPVIIVGGGLAGLCCARTLTRAGQPVKLYEASDGLGGRVRSDVISGGIVDRGFQVLTTSYPVVGDEINLQALRPGSFAPGARIYRGARKEWVQLDDPFRKPGRLINAIFSGLGSWRERAAIAQLRLHSCTAAEADLQQAGLGRSLADWFHSRGLHGDLYKYFMKPWYAGITLDPELNGHAGFGAWLYGRFASGDAILPAHGMGAISQQIAADIPADCVHLQCPVAHVLPDGVTLTNGDHIEAERVIVAAEGPAAARLLREAPPPPGNGVRHLVFGLPAEDLPFHEPYLILDGTDGPATNACFPSSIHESYAPKGEHRLSVTVLGCETDAEDPCLIAAVREQLRRWFGPKTDAWWFVVGQSIAYAQPRQLPADLTPWNRSVMRPDGIIVCGDHRAQASIQGAIDSGVRAAQAHLKSCEQVA